MSGLEFTEVVAERLEAVYMTPDVVEQRCRTLRAMNLRPGERVLDIGSGPGLLAKDIAATVGAAGAVVGVDMSAPMTSIARKRCEAFPHVPRPKTKTRDRLTLPAVLLPVLRAWWDAHGQPRQGPVFPSRRGKRTGERKEGKHSYAKALREVLWDAGVVRALPGFWEAFEVYQGARADLARNRSKEAVSRVKAVEQRARSLCLIQAGSAELRGSCRLRVGQFGKSKMRRARRPLGRIWVSRPTPERTDDARTQCSPTGAAA